jgi:hypothetical protein
MVTEHHHHSARACTSCRGRLLRVDFFGSISRPSADRLCHLILPSRRGMAVSLERIDTALTIFTGPVGFDADSYPRWIPPAAVVVREDQWERQQELCRLLALIGVIRVPFLVSQLAWAQAFSERVVARSH